jgi:hypothetical protein
MMNRISVMMTAVGLSVASLSAHAAAKELRWSDDASPVVNRHVGINRVDINRVDGNHVESGATGGSTGKHIVTPGIPRRPSSPVKAPEIDPVSAVGGLTLLAGAIIVLRGRRRRVLTPC